MSFLEGETNVSPFAIYKEITEEKFSKMNEKIKQYEQVMDLKDEANRRYYLKCCFDDIISSKNIRNNYTFGIIILEKGNIDETIIKQDKYQDKLKKLFSQFKINFEKQMSKGNGGPNLALDDEHKNDPSLKNDENKNEILPKINIQLKFLSKIYYLYEDKTELINFIVQEIILNNNKIENKIDSMKEFFENKENFAKKEFKTIEDAKFFIRLFLEINYLNGVIEYIFQTNFVIKKINQEINKILYLKEFLTIFNIQKNHEIINEISDIIYQIYTISDKLKELINECKDRFEYNISENKNIIHLLKYIIIQSEKDVLMNIKPHSLLCKKSIIKINIEEKKDQLKDLYFYGNSCIKDIYRNLSKKNNSKNIVYYITNNKSENDEQYKALNEFDKKVILKISKKEIEKNISMLVKDGGLTQKFMDILKSWFKYFSKGKDQMTIPDLVECFNILTNKKTKKFTEKSYKIIFFLKKYSDNLNSIVIDKFINFFYIKTIKGINEDVWMNLQNMNFRSDLSKIPQLKENNILPRYYLSNETEENKDMNFMNIFKEKYKTSTNKEIYDLLFFLSTDEKLYDYILNNFNKDENMKFTKRQDEYLYNLYIINIILSIFEDVELKNNKNDKLKDIIICENEYDLYKTEYKIELKNKFVVDFIRNNYSDLINFTIKNLEKFDEMQDEKDIEKFFIIIKLNEKCLELINRIYFYYHNIPLETKNEGFITLGKFSLKLFIEENNLTKEIKAEAKYKDLILQIMKIFDKYYLSDNNIYEKIKGIYDNSFYLFISLLFEKKDIFDDIMNNEEKKNLLNKILNYILMQEKQKNNKIYIRSLYKINLSIEEIHIFLIDLSFSILKSFEGEKLETLFSLFIKTILNNGINSENKKIKEKVLSSLHNYIKDDFNDVKSGPFLQVFGKILEEQNKSKIDIMEEKYNNTNLYEIIYDKIIKKEEEILKNKYQKYDDMKNFLNSGIEKEKYIEYDIVKKKIDELFKTNNNNEKNDNNEQNKALTDSLITFFKSYINKNTKNNKIISKIVSSIKKLIEKEANQFNFNSSESQTPDPNSNMQENKIKKSSPYTGIRNLGTLCYLGTIIQQLFWIPKFRYSILSVDDLKPVDKSYEYTDDDNTLHQTQKLYTYLLLSSYGEVIPKDFIFSIKIFGERVNIKQMLDSSEFYHNFCDIIHNSLENTKYKTLIEDLFCGKSQEKRICSNCGNTSSKEEEFKQISLEVKDKNDLYESLDQYISEEIIDDYKCDKCNNKVKLKKSALFSSLPNILVFHLKRILYNNMGEMEKIYSKFDFPINDLNIKKYCLNSNSDNNDENDDKYKYNLIGINIHKGTADGGHYINLIKTSKEENKWYLFDDSHVEEYDFKNFDDDFNKNDKKTNTYILFYESVKEKQIQIPNEKLMNKKYLIDVFNDNKMYDYLYGKKIIDIKNNLIQLVCDILNNDSFKLKEKNLTYIDISKLLDILIKLFINFYSLEKTRNNPEEKDIKNLVNIINKVFIPIVQEDNIVNGNNNYKLKLIKEIKEKFFSDVNIKLFFANKQIKDLNEKLYELIHLIIEENKKEDENIFKKNDFQETISFIISRKKNLSNHLYKIFYELITFNPDAYLIHIDENSFIDLFYGVREEENPDNYKDISNIFEYYIDKKNILEENDKINKVLIEDLNDTLIILLFDESKKTLLKLIQKIQYNNKEISDMFNLDIIQKLYNYCLKDKDKIKEKQIKLMQLIFDILDIKDRYIEYRTRLLLGFPTLVMQSSDNTFIQKFGVNILNNDINKEIYEYSNYNLIKKDRCVLSYLFPSMYYKNDENKLEDSDRCDLIYELINRALGLNENNEGNYFLFKTLYLMQSRSIKYDNLYQEMKSILEKTGNDKYDLNKINQAEKGIIQFVNYEVENMKKTIDKHNSGNDEKNESKPNLPEQYNKWEELLNLNFKVDYIGCVSNIFPNDIGKIEIITKLEHKKLNVLRFKIYTTYFTKKELIAFSSQNKPFTYENVERGSPSIDNKKENEKILDFSIFQEKKDLKEFISYIIELLKENNKVIIENKDIINKYEIKNTLNKFYALSNDNKNVIKSQITYGEMFIDEINNFYLPEYIYNSVEENQAINLFNVHSLKNEYKFFESNDIGISIKCAKYDKYYKDIFK